MGSRPITVSVRVSVDRGIDTLASQGSSIQVPVSDPDDLTDDDRQVIRARLSYLLDKTAEDVSKRGALDP